MRAILLFAFEPFAKRDSGDRGAHAHAEHTSRINVRRWIQSKPSPGRLPSDLQAGDLVSGGAGRSRQLNPSSIVLSLQLEHTGI